jgi:cation diffusion facilitator family transporter
VALTIFGAAAALAWQSVVRILNPPHVPQVWTLPLLVGVMVVKEWFSRRLLRKQNELHSSALKAEAWHHRTDAITSAAAFVGITIAVAGGPTWASADGWAALVACIFIITNGLGIMRGSLGEMMDTVVTAELEQSVRALAGSVEGVRGVEKCRVRKSGLSHLVDIHVEVDGGLTVREGHAIAHAVKEALLGGTLGVSDALVHIEPAPEQPAGMT